MSDTAVTAAMIAELPDSRLDDRVWLRLRRRVDANSRDDIESLHPLIRAYLVTRTLIRRWATAGGGSISLAACQALLEDDEGPLVTTGLVIAEAAYLINRQLGPAAEAALYSPSLTVTWKPLTLAAPTGSGSAS